jgi:nicotinamide riboside transporter PnuC
MTLLNVLYIFGLHTNLLFKSVFYKASLYGSFNKGIIYIRAKDNSLVLKIIKRDTIYIIN